MIAQYKYCGYLTTTHGNILIWGYVLYVENGFTNTYMFWGSPKNPIIKSYRYSRGYKKQTMAYRINEKRKSWSGYTEISDSEVETIFPELNSQIGMYVLAKKLKSNV